MSKPGWGRMFAKVVAVIFRLTESLLLLFLATICIVMLTQVFSRYLLNAPLTWPEELSRYLFIWVVFLGAAIAFRHKAHLGMDFITERLPLKLKGVTERVVEFIILGFLILIIYISPEVIGVTRFQTSPVLNLPMSYVYLSFPVAGGLMIIELVDRWFFSSGGKTLDSNSAETTPHSTKQE